MNPDHLYWATAKENQADSVRHGTKVRGTAHKGSKLEPHEVISIRDDFEKGTFTLQELSEKYGVSFQVLTRIRKGTAWPHIGGPRSHNHLVKRINRGEMSNGSKLTSNQVFEIYRLRIEERMQHKELAARFNVSKSLIGAILQGKAWAHLYPEADRRLMTKR